MTTVLRGKLGEELTCQYIEKMGMQALHRNYYCRMGEIDIIARDADTIAFIEVKTRSSKKYGTAAEAVTGSKIKKMIATAQVYIMENNLHSNNFRFDVAEVYERDGMYKINYIANAFEV